MSGSTTSLVGRIVGTPVFRTHISGVISEANTSIVILSANPNRRGFEFQNLSETHDMWLSFGGIAGPEIGNFLIPSGALYESPSHGVPKEFISIFCFANNQPYTAKTW